MDESITDLQSRVERLENTVRMLESEIKELISINNLKFAQEVCSGCGVELSADEEEFCGPCGAFPEYGEV